MNEIMQLIEESASKLFESIAATEAVEIMESGEFPQQAWSMLVDDGWLQVTLAEENGGAGLIGGYLLMQLAGYHATPLPIVESLLANHLLEATGFSVEDELLIPAIHKSSMQDSEKIVLAGVPWARHADGLLIISPEDQGCRFVIVKPESYSLTPGENMAGEPRDDVSLDYNVLIEDSRYHEISIERIFAWLALGRAAQMTGALEKVLQQTVDYANERKQFGRQIGKFQAVQQQLVVQAEHTSAAACAVDVAKMHLSTKQEWECIAAAKIITGEAAGIAARTAHAIHAAIGFTREYPLQLSTRRLWSWRDEYGNETSWSNQLGKHCFQKTEDNKLWNWLTMQTG